MPTYPKGTSFLYFSNVVISLQKTSLEPGKKVLVEENLGTCKNRHKVPTEELRPVPQRHSRFDEIKCVTG